MNKRAFTLIELLIVVLIIAILAAIAIPNFMEFQTRAKVSRVKSDIRTIATGMEAYNVEYNGTYPASMADNGTGIYFGMYLLTSPVAFLTTVPKDPFGEKEFYGEKYQGNYEFGCGKAGIHNSGWNNYPNDTFMLESAGPDNLDSTRSGGDGWFFPSSYYPWVDYDTVNVGQLATLLGTIYDPTNGTVSNGGIFRTGGVRPDTALVKIWFDIVNSH